MSHYDTVHIGEQPVGTAFLSLLRSYDVEVVFGMPGVHNLELYRGLAASGITHVLIRHEQAAGFMADGYARASGKPGVAFTISGPGVTNIATALGQAYSDSVPVFLISSALYRHQIGIERGKVHEMPDQLGAVAQFCKVSGLAQSPAQAEDFVHRAFCMFASSRPRPAHISLPQDILELATTPFGPPRAIPSRPVPPRNAIAHAVALLAEAKRPALIVGGGGCDAGVALLSIAEKCGAAVITTIAGKGAVDDSHDLSLGSTLQRPCVQEYLERCDLVFAIGTELAEPDLYITADAETETNGVVQQPDRLELSGKVIRLDIDPSMTVRDFGPALALTGDANETLQLIDADLPRSNKAHRQLETIARLKQLVYRPATRREAAHQVVLDAIREVLPDDGIMAGDMTQLAYTGCVLFRSKRPRSWLFPNGFGTLGYALPAAIGASFAAPQKAVVALVGDGGFMFTLAELATAAEHRLPLAIVLWDNSALAEIRDGMDARGIAPMAVTPTAPDFADIARAFGCAYAAPEDAGQLSKKLSEAFGETRPTIIHLREDTVMDWPTA